MMADLDVPINNGPGLSVVIVTYRSNPSIQRCLDSIARYGQQPLQVVIVDNRETVLPPIDLDIVLVRPDENIGFGRATNLGMKHTKYETILLLNPDTVLFRDTLPCALTHLSKAEPPTIVGAPCVTMDGCLNPLFKGPLHSLRNLFALAMGASWYLPRSASGVELRSDEYLAGCFLLMHRTTWQKVGGFDERFFLYFEDADLRIRSQKEGVACEIASDARYRHDGGPIPRHDAWKIDCFARNGLRFLGKHWTFPVREMGQLLMLAWWVRRRCVASIHHFMSHRNSAQNRP